MTDKVFPTLHVASTICGVGLCNMKFSQMHEIAEHLFGGPVWTHELGSGPTKDAIRAEGVRQFPNMPTREEAQADHATAAANAVAQSDDEEYDVERGLHCAGEAA